MSAAMPMSKARGTVRRGVGDLARAERQVVPALIRPHHRDHHDAERTKRRRNRGNDWRQRQRGGMQREREDRQRRQRRDLQHRQRGLQTIAGLDADVVDRAERDDGNRRDDLPGRNRPASPRQRERKQASRSVPSAGTK